jgi:Rrf2 family transcriptional regulator, iron-sulfur cluster assembly transcription factor
MFAYGQTSANAIAVMSYLAAVPGRRAGSGEIAEARGMSHALTAKLLTQLASAGLVKGQPGPHGGYTLAKNSEDISLFVIASLFEQLTAPTLCAFGRDWCGNGDPCPLHDKIHSMVGQNLEFMQSTRLSVFIGCDRNVKSNSHPTEAVINPTLI